MFFNTENIFDKIIKNYLNNIDSAYLFLSKPVWEEHYKEKEQKKKNLIL